MFEKEASEQLMRLLISCCDTPVVMNFDSGKLVNSTMHKLWYIVFTGLFVDQTACSDYCTQT